MSVPVRSFPLSKRRATVLLWPRVAAKYSAVFPIYNRDTQTDRQTDAGKRDKGRQTDSPCLNTLTLPYHDTHTRMHVQYIQKEIY
jgi:hypothetical protein